MLFSTPIFLFAFLPITLLAYFLSPTKLKNFVLLCMSLLFYSWGEPYLILVMLLSIVANFYFGCWIEKYKKNYWVLILSILFNLSVLFIFKYLMFFISNINLLFGTDLPIFNIILPIGISFYTFQSLSYCVDVYNKKINAQKNVFTLALYITFFPQLIAGPIVRYIDIQLQLVERKVRCEDLYYGFARFIIGLGKKILIANVLAEVCDEIFDVHSSNWTVGMAWLAMLCYTFQIYFDFSAYSDMAIGLARMFGFRFNENFNYPYRATSIKEFWRRWHISLSTWFRDYVYIPLGGNRVSLFKAYRNQFIVFALCGFWHGASWNFIIWGLLHGSLLVLDNYFSKRLKFNIPIILKYLLTFILVLCAWVFFRAETLEDSITIIKVLAGFSKITTGYNVYQYITPLITIVLVIAWPASIGLFRDLYLKVSLKRSDMPYLVLGIEFLFLFVILFLSIISIASGAYNPFIYMRF